MKVPVFSIRDEKAAAFGPVWTSPTIGLASRMFGEMANDRNQPAGRHPEDFRLYQVGFFDDESGSLVPLSTPDFVASALNYVEKESGPVGPRAVRG